MVYLLAFLVLMAVCILLLLGKNPEEIVKEGKYKTTTALGLAVIFIWSVISLSGVSTFLYFNF
jgi:alginate O-acetyltransferase complex protein AlgI